MPAAAAVPGLRFLNADGAMAAGCLFDPALVRETFLLGVDRLLEDHAQVSRGTSPMGR